MSSKAFVLLLLSQKYRLFVKRRFSRLRNEIMLSLIQKPDQNAPFYMSLLYTNYTFFSL